MMEVYQRMELLLKHIFRNRRENMGQFNFRGTIHKFEGFELALKIC